MASFVACFGSQLCECAACLACNCCCKLIETSLADATRLGHFLIFVVVMLTAIILGTYYTVDIAAYSSLINVNISGTCNSLDLQGCLYDQLILRASLSLSILFATLAVLRIFFDSANKNFWSLKLLSAIGMFFAFWWTANE